MIKIQYFLIKNDECGNNMKKSLAQKVEEIHIGAGMAHSGNSSKKYGIFLKKIIVNSVKRLNAL